MMTFIVLILGGALGAISRYECTKYFSKFSISTKFPIGTFIINLLGSLGLGIFIGLHSPELRLPLDTATNLFNFAGIGFFGAFTTFSTFSVESYALIRKKTQATAIIYIMLTLSGSTALFLLGAYVGK